MRSVQVERDPSVERECKTRACVCEVRVRVEAGMSECASEKSAEIAGRAGSNNDRFENIESSALHPLVLPALMG